MYADFSGLAMIRNPDGTLGPSRFVPEGGGGGAVPLLRNYSPLRPGLPPQGMRPPVPEICVEGPASRPSEASRGGVSLWDKNGGECWNNGDQPHNPHWDYSSWKSGPNTPWENIPAWPGVEPRFPRADP